MANANDLGELSARPHILDECVKDLDFHGRLYNVQTVGLVRLTNTYNKTGQFWARKTR